MKFLEDLKFFQVYKSTEKLEIGGTWTCNGCRQYPRFGTRDFSVQHNTEHL